MSPRDPSPWYQAAFEAPYLTLYRHRSDEAAREEVAWAAAHLRRALREGGLGDRLLDLGCGNGRHARALAATGLRVTGLDYSKDLLDAARRSTERDAAAPRYLRADMRALPLRPGSFDVVTSFFTSFGYFEDEADDRQVLAEVARVLVPGGRYLLDFLDARSVRDGLVPESFEEREGWRLRQRRSISPDGRRVEKEVQMTGPQGEQHHYTESVRLYEEADFQRLFAQAGLTIDASYGGLHGEARGPRSKRLVLLSHRDDGPS